MKMSMDRIFVAVPLTEPARAEIVARLGGACPAGLPGRSVPLENWHLTLRFIGNASREVQSALIGELAVLERNPPFSIVFGRCGAFPRPSRASILWLGINGGEPELSRLAGATEECVRRAGFPAEVRAFSPHLTLSRLKTPADLRSLLDTLPEMPTTMPVESVVVYRSVPGSGFPRYEPVARFPLQGSGEAFPDARPPESGTKISGEDGRTGFRSLGRR
jgi:RNA 2',3'-cyclic 3'-phosphodiesterase